MTTGNSYIHSGKLGEIPDMHNIKDAPMTYVILSLVGFTLFSRSSEHQLVGPLRYIRWIIWQIISISSCHYGVMGELTWLLVMSGFNSPTAQSLMISLLFVIPDHWLLLQSRDPKKPQAGMTRLASWVAYFYESFLTFFLPWYTIEYVSWLTYRWYVSCQYLYPIMKCTIGTASKIWSWWYKEVPIQ